jgi:putative acetyltransferase
MSPPEPAPVNPSSPAPAWELRRAGADDAPAFARMMAQSEVFGQLLQLPHPDAELWRQRLLDQRKPGQPDIHLVAVAGDQVVGSAGLHMASPMLRRRHAMSLGIAVALDWHGQGIGSALLTALCDYADNWLGILRLELTVFADNLAAQALYRKFGFEPEGRLRAFALRDGELVDAVAMARLHPRPPRLPA